MHRVKDRTDVERREIDRTRARARVVRGAVSQDRNADVLSADRRRQQIVCGDDLSLVLVASAGDEAIRCNGHVKQRAAVPRSGRAGIDLRQDGRTVRRLADIRIDVDNRAALSLRWLSNTKTQNAAIVSRTALIARKPQRSWPLLRTGSGDRSAMTRPSSAVCAPALMSSRLPSPLFTVTRPSEPAPSVALVLEFDDDSLSLGAHEKILD